MDCTLASNLIVFSGIAFAAFVGYTTEYILAAKPTNYLAKWRDKRQQQEAKPISVTI